MTIDTVHNRKAIKLIFSFIYPLATWVASFVVTISVCMGSFVLPLYRFSDYWLGLSLIPFTNVYIKNTFYCYMKVLFSNKRINIFHYILKLDLLTESLPKVTPIELALKNKQKEYRRSRVSRSYFHMRDRLIHWHSKSNK